MNCICHTQFPSVKALSLPFDAFEKLKNSLEKKSLKLHIHLHKSCNSLPDPALFLNEKFTIPSSPHEQMEGGQKLLSVLQTGFADQHNSPTKEL